MAEKYYKKRSCKGCRAYYCFNESAQCLCTLEYKIEYRFATESLSRTITHKDYYFVLFYCKPSENCPKPRTYAKKRVIYQERVKAGLIKAIKL